MAADFATHFEDSFDCFSVLLEYVRMQEDLRDVDMIPGNVTPKLLQGLSELGSAFFDAISRSWRCAARPEGVLAEHFASDFDMAMNILPQFEVIDHNDVFQRYVNSFLHLPIPESASKIAKFLPGCRNVPETHVQIVSPVRGEKITQMSLTNEQTDEMAVDALSNLQKLMRRQEPDTYSQKSDVLQEFVEYRRQTIHGQSIRSRPSEASFSRSAARLSCFL
jgi:hypothetical protein